MAGFIIAACAKGAICYCLDEFSKGRGARSRVTKLRDAIVALADQNYQGLADVFDKYLMSYVIQDAAERAKIVAFLERYWFNAQSPQTFFKEVKVAEIYAQGVVKALELSLAGRRVVPLNAWWILDSASVKLLTLGDVNEKGETIGGRVTLLIMTPRPERGGAASQAIMGDTAVAWVTHQTHLGVLTNQVTGTGEDTENK